MATGRCNNNILSVNPPLVIRQEVETSQARDSEGEIALSERERERGRGEGERVQRDVVVNFVCLYCDIRESVRFVRCDRGPVRTSRSVGRVDRVTATWAH